MVRRSNNQTWMNTRCAAAICAAALSGGFFAGCDTIGQDVDSLGAALKPTTPGEAARMMVNPHNADDRREGVVLISNATFGGLDVYVANYRDMVLNERDPIVKAVAIRALARHGQPEDALRIAPLLTHENVQVRWETAKGLQRLHNPMVVPDLLKALRNDVEQADVRIAAAMALGQYPEDRVMQGLISALDARELAINAAAEKSLSTLTGKSFEMDSHGWLSWYVPAAKAGIAFDGQQEYFYPTYTREDTIWETLAFWTTRNFEHPGPPAGLRPKSERSTYGEDEQAPGTLGNPGS